MNDTQGWNRVWNRVVARMATSRRNRVVAKMTRKQAEALALVAVHPVTVTRIGLLNMSITMFGRVAHPHPIGGVIPSRRVVYRMEQWRTLPGTRPQTPNPVEQTVEPTLRDNESSDWIVF